MSSFTTIQISKETKALLLQLMKPQESYDSVVNRIAKEKLVVAGSRVVSKDSILDALSKVIEDIRNLE